MYKFFLQDDFDYSLLAEPPVIFISDIDETYLQTDFKSLKGLVTAAVQFAVDKITYPDMSLFYRTVRRARATALYFISSSPVQLRGIMLKKFLLEEVPCDGIVLRDTIRLVVAGHGGEVRNPFGYKLLAILTLMKSFPRASRLVFLGDDTESDSAVYESIKALADGSLGLGGLRGRLEERQIHPDHVAQVIGELDDLPVRGFHVAGIFIRRTGHGTADCNPSEMGRSSIVFEHPRTIIEVLLSRGIITGDQAAWFDARQGGQ